MTGPISLSEAELTALSELASGKGDAASAAGGALASLVERGQARLEDGKLVFTEEISQAFQPLATCRVHLLVMDDVGSPVDQFYVGAEQSAAKVVQQDSGIAFQRLAPNELTRAVAAGVVAHLTSAGFSPLPSTENFSAAADVLGMEGLQPLAWGGLVVVHAGSDPGSDEPVRDWVLIVRCEPGFFWQDVERNVVAFADSEEEVADLVAQLLANF